MWLGKNSWRAWAAATASVILLACGGGGGSAGDPLMGGGGSGGGTVQASDLSIVLSGTQLDNSGTTSIKATVTAVGAGGQALAGIAVAISVDADALYTASGAQTDDQGVVTADIWPGDNRANRTVTVTAKANNGDLQRSKSFRVTGANLNATAVPSIVQGGSSNNQVQFRLVDKAGNAMAGETITVAGTGLPSATGTTGSNGEYIYTYTAPSSDGTLDVTGDAAGSSKTVQVSVQASSTTVVPPVNSAVTPVLSSSVSAAPNVVGVNTASPPTNRSEIRALFQSTNNASVKNVRVRFDLAGDANSIGGTFLSGNNIVYSDAQGVALTAYYPSTRSSPTNGVTVRACWDYDDFAAGTCPHQATTSLTVTSEPVNVRISTNEIVKSGINDLTYIKEYVVSVVASSGQAKADVEITPSVDLLYYIKGPAWKWTGKAWMPRTFGNFPAQTLADDPLLVNSYLACINEDANRNNLLEAGEDINGNGTLEPRKADVTIKMVNGSKTDASGLAVLQIEYGRSLASWVQFKITVTAGGISGTEGRDTYIGILPWSGVAQATEVPAPAWLIGPYGSNVTTCTNPN